MSGRAILFVAGRAVAAGRKVARRADTTRDASGELMVRGESAKTAKFSWVLAPTLLACEA
jgi:hypothetical protein